MRKNIGNDFALPGIACCNNCGVPLRSSWFKGRSKSYAYYLCQTKTCESFGKSVARSKVETDVGDLVKALQPSSTLVTLVTQMLKYAWDHKHQQVAEAAKSSARQLAGIEKQIESILERIMGASNAVVIEQYERKIAELAKQKALLAEKSVARPEIGGSFADHLEPVLTFFANPWKLWAAGNITLRRIVLKLAFTDRIKYCRNEGTRTAQIALLFKRLRGISQGEV